MTRFRRSVGELAVGEWATLTRPATPQDLYVFARASEPIHAPAVRPDQDGHNVSALCHPVGSMLSAVLDSLLPGLATAEQHGMLRFRGRAQVGDWLTVRAVVIAKRPPCRLALEVTIHRGKTLIAEGAVEVLAPAPRPLLEKAFAPGGGARRRPVGRLLAACRRFTPFHRSGDR